MVCSECAKRADSPAKMMSVRRASSKPPPEHSPRTAETTGTEIRSSLLNAERYPSNFPRSSATSMPGHGVMSPP